MPELRGDHRHLREEREVRPEFYVAERQVNPLNFKRAKVHQVIPDLNVADVAKFASRHEKQIAFGLTDTEDFVTAGGRDVVERETGVPMLCVTKEFAVEASKADQRLLFERICPKANPRYKVFDPSKYPNEGAAVADLRSLSRELDGGFAIKPDAPARGAGVGVSGKDFQTEEEAVGVLPERLLEGKGRRRGAHRGGGVELPRLQRRAPLRRRPADQGLQARPRRRQGQAHRRDGELQGPREGLPFLPPSEWEKVVRLERDAFEKWKGRGSNPALRGIVLYDALMHTRGGFKILERNSRGGNTEQICLLTTMLDDYVDVCYRMVDGSLKGIRFSNKASVVTCAVPLSYGTSASQAPGEAVDLDRAFALEKRHEGDLRVFPMDLRLDQTGLTLMGASRSVAVAGIAASLKEAHAISVEGVSALGDKFRHRADVGSETDIARSREHLRKVRRAARS